MAAARLWPCGFRVFGPFEFAEVHDGLYVGPCPHSPERIRRLKETGIDGLVCVQTDRDLETFGMAWPVMWKYLMAQGIVCFRRPIVDFDDKALRSGLTEAVDGVAELRGAGRRVYVHCSAGVNRSPTVAIGYLVRHCGMDVETAWQQVTTRRSCAPNRAVLTAWAAAL